MKTLALVAAVVAGMAAGFGIAKPEQHKAEVSFTFPADQVLNVRYASSSQEGAIESWIHCGLCKQGVIRKEDGKCSYCGKDADEQPKN